jgi:iron complex transport system substrate-binding protein
MVPPRVVSLAPSITEIVCALGCGEWLVGGSRTGDRPETVPVPGRPAPQRLAPQRLADERLAALRPDLVLEPGECATLADLWREFRRVAGSLGVPERGVQLVTRTSGRMRAIAERAGTLGRRPRVVFIEHVEPLAAAGGWTPELVVLAGGEDVAGTTGGAAAPLDGDALHAAGPDVVWIAPRGHDLAGARAGFGTLAARPGFPGLEAGRATRVFGGDGLSLFHRPGPRIADSLEALAEALHPAAFRFGHEGRGWELLSADRAPAASSRK